MSLSEAFAVPGYEGAYSVTRDGRLYSHISKKWLSNKPHKTGYVYWRLSGKQIKAHRVVAMTFIGDIEGKVINHINVSRSDNRVENLEIVTHKENSEHAAGLGLYPRGEAHMAKLDTIQVLTIATLSGNGWGNRKLAKHFNVGRSAIDAIAKNKKWKHLDIGERKNGYSKNKWVKPCGIENMRGY